MFSDYNLYERELLNQTFDLFENAQIDVQRTGNYTALIPIYRNHRKFYVNVTLHQQNIFETEIEYLKKVVTDEVYDRAMDRATIERELAECGGAIQHLYNRYRNLEGLLEKEE